MLHELWSIQRFADGVDQRPAEAKVAAGTAGAVVQPAANQEGDVQAAPPGDVSMAWQAPARVKAGEQFAAELRLTSTSPLRGLPVVVGFDPKVLEVTGVQEGGYFKQGGGQSHFSQRVDQGQVFVDLVRQGPSGEADGVDGTGTAFTIIFRALKAGDAKIQVMSANPEPPATSAVSLTPTHLVKVGP